MKYIDAEKLKVEMERLEVLYDEALKNPSFASYESSLIAKGKHRQREDLLSLIDSLQQEQPMPDSTKLIELWHEDKEKLKEKDFRNDQWRLAYNAFLCGFGRGIAVNKQEQPEVDFETEYAKFTNEPDELEYAFPIDLADYKDFARHFYELGLNAKKEEPVSDDLEEAAEQYLDNHKPLTRYNWGDLMDAFKAGAEWGAEHVKR